MQLHQLQYFLAVARHRNFSRAAESLHLAQPALSQQIAKLEEELGSRLFRRGRRESCLTDAGAALVPRAEALLSQLETTIREIRSYSGPQRSRLVIATIPSVSGMWLPGIIQGFRKQHPEVELHLREESSEGVADWVRRGGAEMGILQLPAPQHELEARPWKIERFLVVLPANHASGQARRMTLKQLKGEKFILYKGRARDLVLERVRELGWEPEVACETGSPETVRALVAAGLGIAILPEMAVPGRSGAGWVALPLESPVIRRELAWVRRRHAGWSEAAESFVRHAWPEQETEFR